MVDVLAEIGTAPPRKPNQFLNAFHMAPVRRRKNSIDLLLINEVLLLCLILLVIKIIAVLRTEMLLVALCSRGHTYSAGQGWPPVESKNFYSKK